MRAAFTLLTCAVAHRSKTLFMSGRRHRRVKRRAYDRQSNFPGNVSAMRYRSNFMPRRAFILAVFIALIGVVTVSFVGNAMHRDMAACEAATDPCSFP
jgi:hypothetical protein